MTTVPNSVRAIFERFPLVVYPAASQPACASNNNKYEEKDFQVTLYVSAATCSDKPHQDLLLAIDPNALYIQNCLTLCKIPYRLFIVSDHASPSGHLPFLIAKCRQTSGNKRFSKTTSKLYEFLPLQRSLYETISDIAASFGGGGNSPCAPDKLEQSVSDGFFIVSCLETFDTAWKASMVEKCNRHLLEAALVIPSRASPVSRFIVDSHLSALHDIIETRLYPMKPLVSPFAQTNSSLKKTGWWWWWSTRDERYTLLSDSLAKVLSNLETVLDALQVRLGEDQFFTPQLGHLDMIVSSFIHTVINNCSSQCEITILVASNNYTRLHDHSKRVFDLLYNHPLL